MFDYLGKDIELHKSLTDYLCSIHLEGRHNESDILDIYNKWPDKSIYCSTEDRISWALYYIREKTRTSNILFKEAVKIDDDCRRKPNNRLRKIKIK